MEKRITIMILCIFATQAFAIDWDERLSAKVREDLKCPAMDISMETASILGSKEFAMGANLAVYTFGNDRLDDMANIATLSLGTGAAITTSLKTIINRKRPLETEEDRSPRWDSSFPSGHATAAFSTAVSYGLQNKKLMVPLLTGAAIVAFTRVYLGHHYIIDVIAGAIVGSASAIIIYQFREEIYDNIP
ncbi:MAG: phosphatase PAP2 family protein [Candidatus Zixiibacteriota bacterium]